MNSWLIQTIVVLPLASALDYAIGDPPNWLHPVQVMGWGIDRYTQWVLKTISSILGQRFAGILLGVGLVAGSGLLAWGLIWGADRLHPLMGVGVQTVLLASCFAGRSLRQAAETVLQALQFSDLAAARIALRRYVGRDTESLPESEILRAVLETVTENATDAVMAPLFYALIGAAIPGCGGAPLALAYKAASTLDSMIGYRTPPYTYLGWFSARWEDGLTWVPCRLTVLTIALLSNRPYHVWKLCQRDAVKDPSPNSGWSECAYAAALDVQMGGINWYQGVAREKPLLGDRVREITPERIDRALKLTRYSFLIWLVTGLVILTGIQIPISML
ncbi:MAG: adenosylcobinamide-phosphate synthase CbiB [Leptolyngbyaceae cyanobacterium bins.59]|nr:adenosylcobinamide-phosphate synthase CbiB [Leptolyngbyaceae cyanobacterium bins.59]